ncbi:uncharacterized protein F4812DRAFT_463928 [Daldinia caldariorum]|uniref:uncharacterized protein n=1 Tax=Daldinia caldariorum TaxID=326644 RepID=UPI002008D6D6|nr:uncharacterized protein F4812DRAFT_463928 [Daldinia caldariorum]KAI1463235.1 hypothetical protein F4812DRAFT_463928 [Daldinia caldariorum]
MRNPSLAFFDASAPIGGYVGGFIAGEFIERASLMWMLVFIAAVSLVVTVALWALLPREVSVDHGEKLDWI